MEIIRIKDCKQRRKDNPEDFDPNASTDSLYNGNEPYRKQFGRVPRDK
jgi:hypothetical protein